MKRRCPRLGGVVSFAYCLKGAADNRPCWKSVDCWWEFFDVVSYLKATLSPEEFQQLINTRPQPKVASLVDLIAQARNRLEE